MSRWWSLLTTVVVRAAENITQLVNTNKQYITLQVEEALAQMYALELLS